MKGLHSLYSSSSIIRMRWSGLVARMGRIGMHIEYWWEIQKEREREHCRRLRFRYMDNIKMDLREVRWDGWSGSIWLRIRTSGGLL
jgi:hypothetical protein